MSSGGVEPFGDAEHAVGMYFEAVGAHPIFLEESEYRGTVAGTPSWAEGATIIMIYNFPSYTILQTRTVRHGFWRFIDARVQQHQ